MKHIVLAAVLTLFTACNTSAGDVCQGDHCECAAGETCAYDCQNGGLDCHIQCDRGTSCDVGCAPGEDCHVDCHDSASCQVDCANSPDCIVMCPASGCMVTECADSRCVVTCGLDGTLATRNGSTASCP